MPAPAGGEGDAAAPPFWMARALAHVDRAAQWLLIALMAVIIAVVSAQVFLRYLFNSSIGWADEISRLAFVWSIFIAIPLGVREGLHIALQLVTARIPAGARVALGRLVALLGVAMMLLVSHQAVLIAWEQWDEKMASVDMSAAMFVVPVAVGGVYSALWLLCVALSGRSYATGVVGVE